MLLGFGASLYYSTFSVAHYLFAENYRKSAKHVPAKLKGIPIEEPSKCEQITFHILVWSNVVSGVLYGLTIIFFLNQILVKDEMPKDWLVNSKIAMTFWNQICMIISGVILIGGVLTIHKYFQD